jgi:hypothetical protein
MARQDQSPDDWPIFLWIAWREGETERVESLCRAHRAYIFGQYPATAHGVKRRGEQCSMCHVQPARIAEFRGRGAEATASSKHTAAPPRGHRPRGSRRRVSPIRHSGSCPPNSGWE